MPGFDDLLNNEKMKKHAQEAMDKVNGTTTSKKNSSKVSDIKVHNFLNKINGNINVVLAKGQNFRACNGWFIKIPIAEDVVAILDTSEQEIDVEVQTYYSSDEQEVDIDWYIRYNIVDAAKMLKKTNEIESTIQEDTEYLMSSYLKTKTADEISKINKVTKNNLEEIYPDFLDKFEETYGVRISVINSNNIVVPLIQGIIKNEKQEASARTINENNSKTEREIRKANAKAELEIRKKGLEIDKKRLEMYGKAINDSKSPESLARMMSDGQSMDIYHHGDQNPRRHR